MNSMEHWGTAPWRRQKIVEITDETGFSTPHYATVEMGCDFDRIWKSGILDWSMNCSESSRIIDATGKTVFAFSPCGGNDESTIRK